LTDFALHAARHVIIEYEGGRYHRNFGYRAIDFYQVQRTDVACRVHNTVEGLPTHITVNLAHLRGIGDPADGFKTIIVNPSIFLQGFRSEYSRRVHMPIGILIGDDKQSMLTALLMTYKFECAGYCNNDASYSVQNVVAALLMTGKDWPELRAIQKSINASAESRYEHV
jgi:hypothetical protein